MMKVALLAELKANPGKGDALERRSSLSRNRSLRRRAATRNPPTRSKPGVHR
ncbi:hypothetical protein MycrhDRAFT_6352 [Mycolicibacterium rhodesiae JS60]|nr:hypothetical protein MycrhDRAFT_6352 [Mycolicibacterium rhodesiae JS60]